MALDEFRAHLPRGFPGAIVNSFVFYLHWINQRVAFISHRSALRVVMGELLSSLQDNQCCVCGRVVGQSFVTTAGLLRCSWASDGGRCFQLFRTSCLAPSHSAVCAVTGGAGPAPVPHEEVCWECFSARRVGVHRATNGWDVQVCGYGSYRAGGCDWPSIVYSWQYDGQHVGKTTAKCNESASHIPERYWRAQYGSVQ